MRTKLFLTLPATLTLASLTFPACYGPPAPTYYGSTYYGPPPGTVVLGDYDEGRVWHDRYWWVSNRHDWVHEHHPDWIAHETPEEHNAYEHRGTPDHRGSEHHH